jgi:deoxyhypusine monooxygenase
MRVLRWARTCFLLKGLGGPEAITALAGGLSRLSVLLKYEICTRWVRSRTRLPIRYGVLRDVSEDSIVRYEAAEALAAIGSPESI